MKMLKVKTQDFPSMFVVGLDVFEDENEAEKKRMEKRDPNLYEVVDLKPLSPTGCRWCDQWEGELVCGNCGVLLS